MTFRAKGERWPHETKKRRPHAKRIAAYKVQRNADRQRRKTAA